MCLDIPILEFSVILEHLPFWPGFKQILRQLLVLRTLAVWIWYPWLLLPSFVMLKVLVQWTLHKSPNRLLQYHLGVQLDLCIFGVLSPIRHSSNDRCPSVRQNELLCPSFLLHQSLLICFWLLSGSTPKISPIFPFLVRCWNCHGLKHWNKFVSLLFFGLLTGSPFRLSKRTPGRTQTLCGVTF